MSPGEDRSTTLTATTIRVPCAPVGGDDPLPLVDRLLEGPFTLSDQVPDPIRQASAFGHPRSLHPYLMQNRYPRERAETDLNCLVLENDHLRAQVLPELGGRLWSLVDVHTGRELLYRNDVVQPANLALRNAWFAGGVEWNIGTKGHAPHTASPVHAARVTGPDGDPTLRLWEFERVRRVVWQVDLRLPPGSRMLQVYVRICNPNAYPVPMYWWSNAAVPEADDVRVIAPAERAYATSYDGSVHVVPVPMHEGIDRSRPTNATRSADYFFDVAEDKPWIAAVDGTGHGLVQVSTARLRGRKLFCWGTSAGGRRWQRWLSPAGGDYLEIQAGLTATQFEHAEMPAGASWSWLEAYGDAAADPRITHGEDWAAAGDHLDERLRDLTSGRLDDDLTLAETLASTVPDEALCTGSGWGALERAARAATGEPWIDETGTPFSPETTGPQQWAWRQLLTTGPDPDPLRAADPRVAPDSYVVGDPWPALLARLPASWARDYHLAVLAHAAADLEAAEKHYTASQNLQANAWALRGLGRIALERGEHAAAARLLREAVGLAPGESSLVVEAVTAVLDAGDAEGAMVAILEAASPDVRRLGRMRLLEAQAALASGDRERAAELLAEGLVVPDLREGETSLSALWMAVHPSSPVPEDYDFRMG